MKRTKRKTLAYKQGYSAGVANKYYNHYAESSKAHSDYIAGFDASRPPRLTGEAHA